MTRDANVATHDATARWLPTLREFAGPFMQSMPALRAIAPEASLVLHGSTTFGVDDAVSDLDVWMLVDQADLPRVDSASPTRFVEFTLDGKSGHLTLHARQKFSSRLSRCDLPLIAELRTAVIIEDPDRSAASLIRRAQATMPDVVRRAWFAYHYIEMRSEHRACDNPIDRGDAKALLFAISAAISHAIRAALVLHGEPYPYVKWLAAAAASRTPTGAHVVRLVDDILELLGNNALRMPGPEQQHPLNLKLREIRNVLIAAARSHGIDGPWLDHWYLYLDMRQHIGDARWDAE